MGQRVTEAGRRGRPGRPSDVEGFSDGAGLSLVVGDASFQQRQRGFSLTDGDAVSAGEGPIGAPFLVLGIAAGHGDAERGWQIDQDVRRKARQAQLLAGRAADRVPGPATEADTAWS